MLAQEASDIIEDAGVVTVDKMLIDHSILRVACVYPYLNDCPVFSFRMKYVSDMPAEGIWNENARAATWIFSISSDAIPLVPGVMGSAIFSLLCSNNARKHVNVHYLGRKHSVCIRCWG